MSHKLDIDELSAGDVQPYAFLIQRPMPTVLDEHGQPTFGFVQVIIRARDSSGNVVGAAAHEEWNSSWTWEVITTDNEIRNLCMGRWYAQAACETGLAHFEVRDAEGVNFIQQLPSGKKTLAGEFEMQGFRVETIKTIAVNWGLAEPESHGTHGFGSEAFELIGGQPPATVHDRLQLAARCVPGRPSDRTLVNAEFYYPRTTMRILNA